MSIYDEIADRSSAEARDLQSPDEDPRRRTAFAASAAQVELGAAYSPPDHSEFHDRSPAEVRAARESRWVGVAR